MHSHSPSATSLTTPANGIRTMPLFASLALGASLLLAGCATTTSPEVRQALDSKQRTLSQPTSIIADGCLVRTAVGVDDILYTQSATVAKAVAADLQAQLKNKGVTTKTIAIPFVCGSVPKDKLTSLDVKIDNGPDVRNTAYPLLAPNPPAPNTQPAYLALFTALGKLDNTQNVNVGKGISVPLALDATSLATLRSSLGTDTVFVIKVDGTKPTFAATMTVGAVTALASGGTYVTTLQQGQAYQLNLVNLATNSVEWRKSSNAGLGANIFNFPAPEGSAIKGLLVPLYPE